MKLIKARIQNFKCIEDSTEFSFDQVTCLVGKNEAGKTALLEALYKLNPVEKDKSKFEEEEFPRRHLSTYRERSDKEPANILTTTWSLEDADIYALNAKLGPIQITNDEIVITKGYDNLVQWSIKLDEKELIENLLADGNFNAAEKAQLAKIKSIGSLIETINSIESPTEKQKSLLSRVLKLYPDGNLISVAINVLNDCLPHFVYFSNYYQLPGRVSIDDLKIRQRENNLEFNQKVFLALLDMTNTGIEEIVGIDQLEKLVMELEAVEASLTDDIKRFWSQNKHLEVRFRYDHAKPGDPSPLNAGFVFTTRIYNTRHRATVRFDERSHGFIWFFSFLVWFSQVKRQYGDNLILLLDEPGLPLHGRAQQDLIRYINTSLRPSHQVIYTAHSPFLIDVENIFSLRTVEDVVETVVENGETIENILGTKVGQRILSRDNDTIFPLQGVLGFDMAQTLFVGPNVVVVEGPTERALFEWFSRELVKQDRDGLDLRWAVCPAESASKISSFVTLFSGRELNIAVFADYHVGQKRMMDGLEQSGLLKEGHILKTSDFLEGQDSDIEDVVGRPLYIELVNQALQLSDRYKIPAEKPPDTPTRVVKEVEDHCRRLPIGYPDFYHYLPIEYLFSLQKKEIESLPGLEEALDRFYKIFQRLNALIEADR